MYRLLYKKISIHALVKRATKRTSAAYILCRISIHALVKRATRSDRRSRLLSWYFNPRPREEGDADNCGHDFYLGISIHALVKRATRTIAVATLSCSISIHALVKRATAFPVLSSRACNISIHALVKRATNLHLHQSR